MDNKNEFKPYIPADKIVPEFTVTSVLIGIILAVVFGAANAYIGLLVGMTISASIPAAVISMGIIRVILRRDSILENNLVQTIGSAGESLAAGAIFTLPALPVSLLQQARSSHCLHFSSGQRKERLITRALSLSSSSHCLAVFSESALWCRSARLLL